MSNTHSFKVGDRFEWWAEFSDQIVHTCDYIGNGEFKCLTGSHEGRIIKNISFLPNKKPQDWKYLGNYAKDTNLTTLYDILEG